MKILILKPSSLGDVVHALPVLRLIKRHLPDSEIYWWIDSALAPLLKGDPDLSGLILFERRRWAAPWRWPEVWRSVWGIRARQFDWVIDLQSLARSAIVAWAANGGLTIGLDDPREGAAAMYDIAVPRPATDAHAVDWYLGVLGHLGVPVENEFIWMPRRPALGESVRQQATDPEATWVMLQPGARWPNKRWPTEHFAQLVKLLAAGNPSLRFAILGGPADSACAAAIQEACPERCLDLSGRTSLPEMVEWIRLGAIMVTNDTGPMHVAAALQKPVIGLFGPTNHLRTGPYKQVNQTIRAGLTCAPCMKSSCTHSSPMECLTTITPEQVAAEVRRRLGESTVAGSNTAGLQRRLPSEASGVWKLKGDTKALSELA